MKRLLVIGTLLCAACATAPATRPAPVLKLHSDDVGAKGTACGAGTLDKTRGARPAASRVVSVVRVEADRAVPLEALEQLIEVAARRRCAAGFAVIRASSDDGATGYLDATAETWATQEPSRDGEAVSAP